MKRLLSLVFLLALLTTGMELVAQQTCCSLLPAPTLFAGFSNDISFVNSHQEPKPFALDNRLGKDIELKSSKGNIVFAYEVAPSSQSKKVVFVFHEWWGLNDYIRAEADKIQEALGSDVRVIALDLYDSKIATTRDSAAKYMQAVRQERAIEIIQTALDYVGPETNIATIGWCFGGGWSMQASLLARKQAKACVMYYGMPEQNKENLKKLSAPVLFVWPTQDQWINKKLVDAFKENMKSSAKSLEVLSFDADHAFANPSNPNHRDDFAKEAFDSAISFIAKEFNR